MAIRLKSGEKIKIKADFHWSSYLVASIWAGFIGMAFLGELMMLMTSSNDIGNKPTFGFLVGTFLLGNFPLLYKFLQNKCKSYVLTSERLYIEDGIISKTKKDIPNNKMNDIEMSQDIIQRLFGAGDILVLTGNDKPSRLSNIDSPEDFKDKLTEVINSRSKKAA